MALVTGARISELVRLQGRDIKYDRRAKAWYLDFSGDLLVAGRVVPRPAKSPSGHPYISLHQVLVDAGFVEWARHRPGFVFDRLHRAQDPAGTASKRMGRLMKQVGIRNTGEVFHSMRHTHKDWLRDQGFHDRTMDLQSGHALQGVAKKYGRKMLSSKEIAELAYCELPEGVQIPQFRS